MSTVRVFYSMKAAGKDVQEVPVEDLVTRMSEKYGLHQLFEELTGDAVLKPYFDLDHTLDKENLADLEDEQGEAGVATLPAPGGLHIRGDALTESVPAQP